MNSNIDQHEDIPFPFMLITFQISILLNTHSGPKMTGVGVGWGGLRTHNLAHRMLGFPQLPTAFTLFTCWWDSVRLDIPLNHTFENSLFSADSKVKHSDWSIIWAGSKLWVCRWEAQTSQCLFVSLCIEYYINKPVIRKGSIIHIGLS